MSECTFNPEILTNEEAREYRTADEFYLDQMNYVSKSNAKTLNTKSEQDKIKDSELKLVPEVCKRSREMEMVHRSRIRNSSKMGQRTGSANSVHERLYSTNRELNRSSMLANSEEIQGALYTSRSKPTINTKSPIKDEEVDYNIYIYI